MANIDNYVIHVKEYIQHGVFFRSPIKKVSYSDNWYGTSHYPAFNYIKKLKNPVFRLFQHLIGNTDIVNNAEEWSKDHSFAGFKANALMSPLYFKRPCRSLDGYAQSSDDNIQEIHSFGFGMPYEDLSGGCELERTTFKLKSRHCIKERKRGSYYFTYAHVIESVIENNKIDKG